jgi:hypothetical protein
MGFSMCKTRETVIPPLPGLCSLDAFSGWPAFQPGYPSAIMMAGFPERKIFRIQLSRNKGGYRTPRVIREPTGAIVQVPVDGMGEQG